MPDNMPATPELDKMLAITNKSQAIGEFLDWVRHERGYVFYEEDDDDGGWWPAQYHTQDLLADFFEIDLNKVETERRAILDAIREPKAR